MVYRTSFEILQILSSIDKGSKRMRILLGVKQFPKYYKISKNSSKDQIVEAGTQLSYAL